MALITGYAIILENEILYCSNESKYADFEIILFVEKLMKTLNPKQSWRLNNILLEAGTKERMIIMHFITDKMQSIFFCITGDFKLDSQEARKMVKEFYDELNNQYKNLNNLKKQSKKQDFKRDLQKITYYLWEKYAPLFEIEQIKKNIDNSIDNKILYCGISTKGLPIISQLYDTALLSNLDKEINDDNVELFNSNISAQLATIAMNTLIRAKKNIKEIHIIDTEDKIHKKVILFETIHIYSLDFIASGNFYRIKKQ